MDEPQPIDPKEASRIIQKRIHRKKTAKEVHKPDTAVRASAGGADPVLTARPLSGDDIVDLLQRTPERLCLAWVRLHDEGRPLLAKQVSRAEIGLIVGS